MKNFGHVCYVCRIFSSRPGQGSGWQDPRIESGPPGWRFGRFRQAQHSVFYLNLIQKRLFCLPRNLPKTPNVVHVCTASVMLHEIYSINAFCHDSPPSSFFPPVSCLSCCADFRNVRQSLQILVEHVPGRWAHVPLKSQVNLWGRTL